MGDGNKDAMCVVISTIPIGPRPSPGWCFLGAVVMLMGSTLSETRKAAAPGWGNSLFGVYK